MEVAELTCVRNDKVRVNRRALEALLQQYQLALQQSASDCDDDSDTDVPDELDAPQDSSGTSAPPSSCDTDIAELYDIVKSGFECPDFITKVEDARISLLQKNMAEEGSSWDMVSKSDLWGGGNLDLETEDFVLVRQEDIMEGIASFMAAYLLSLEQTKDLEPNQLQEALSKTFSVKKKKGKLQKAWDGSKLIYNVASWGATAIGIYQNPALCNAASVAFWTSFRVISKLL